MTEAEKAFRDCLMFGQGFTLDGKHIPLERTMDNLISYREVLDCLMLMRQETPSLHVAEQCRLISRMFGKNVGEVRFDLDELTKETT